MGRVPMVQYWSRRLLPLPVPSGPEHKDVSDHNTQSSIVNRQSSIDRCLDVLVTFAVEDFQIVRLAVIVDVGVHLD